MSFKRDGNDKHMFNVLRQRRIKDLLADNIPEEEATLLSNGRLACTVCSWHPVFDTVNMLSIHRNGKKHLASVSQKQKEKQELQNLILKRKHEQFLKDGTTNINQALMFHKGLSSSIPYDPRVKKRKIKPYDRKPKLNLAETSSIPGLVSPFGIKRVDHISVKQNFKNGESSSTDNVTVHLNSLPGNQQTSVKSQTSEKNNEPKKKNNPKNSKFLEMITLQNDGPVRHLNQLSKIFQTPPDRDSAPHQPYLSKKRRQPDSNTNSILDAVPFKKDQTPVVINLKYSSAKKCPQICRGQEKTFQGNTDTSNITDKHATQTLVPETNQTQRQLSSSAIKEDERKYCQKHWLLGGSGWKRDWDGKWIKDEEAEFDSDEEPPNL